MSSNPACPLLMYCYGCPIPHRPSAGHADTADHQHHGQHLAAGGSGPQVSGGGGENADSTRHARRAVCKIIPGGLDFMQWGKIHEPVISCSECAIPAITVHNTYTSVIGGLAMGEDS